MNWFYVNNIFDNNIDDKPSDKLHIYIYIFISMTQIGPMLPRALTSSAKWMVYILCTKILSFVSIEQKNVDPVWSATFLCCKNGSKSKLVGKYVNFK